MKISSDADFLSLANSLPLTGAQSSFHDQLIRKLQERPPQAEPSEAGEAVKAEEKAREDKKLKQAVEEFEAFFLAQLFKQMRKTVPDSEMFGDGHDREIFEDLLDDERAKQIANGRGFGLAEQLYAQLRPTSQKKLPSLTDNRIQTFLQSSGG